jgi:CubicO group peptidase (beta-lactamase class C family)
MQSGIEFENDGYYGHSDIMRRQVPADCVDFILGLRLAHAPGEYFYYKDGDPHLVSAILQHQTGKTTRDWAKEVLFSKIDFQNYTWEVYKDGVTLGAYGISATPREMARIGCLVLNRGNWNGQQIVNAAWIDEMTGVKVSKEKVNYHQKSFGYFWWIDERRGVSCMFGKGGQYVFVKSSKNLVVVTTADPNAGHIFELETALGIFDKIDEIAK